MASRVFASRLASQMATKAARPAMRAPVAAAKRTITTGESKENFFPQQMMTPQHTMIDLKHSIIQRASV